MIKTLATMAVLYTPFAVDARALPQRYTVGGLKQSLGIHDGLKGGNSASCHSSGSAGSSSEGRNVEVTQVGMGAATKACGGASKAEVELEVKALAKAIAEASVEAKSGCDTQGKASGSGSAAGKSEAQDQATAKAAASVWASAETCGKCKAVAEASAKATETQVVKALAEARVDVAAGSKAGEADSQHEKEVVKVVEEKTIQALASVFATAATKMEGNCSAAAGATAIAGDSKAMCETFALGDVTEIATNGSAIAGADAKAMACGEAGAGVSAMSVAVGLAEAVAQAVAESTTVCGTAGEAEACANAASAAKAVAKAQAVAFAEAFAQAEECGCMVDVQSQAIAFEDILVEAVSSAASDACSSGDSLLETTAKAVSLAEEQVEAVAIAVANAAAGEGCKADAGTFAGTLPTAPAPAPTKADWR